ncbi:MULTISPECIES: hypothetical protein [Chryseobacterium]|uniref:hypothetical protein n=1 Tax=Chryseobacterium TaxID=59732 RepID=UPI0004865675|nr:MULTISPECIES: hypothetical protein [Chryseobacterium]ASE62841.1 hypothetical protein CEQ15_15760 [Chryseobacterium indologenes]ATN06756.1 hypothetical protein CRN76_15760 [Chryseobacterium indologenes]AYY84498.1 hypothetical protein EGX91_08035 [Chryseobacterium indologenes]QIX81453.1 hypothetical protein FOB56_09480 [Chryseobacterium indologenes]TLX25739.1 hypothetical protein FE904_10085 [Chryseobacterium indologenes]
MKYFKFFLLICFLGTLSSCGGDDDICESGEGTPRLRIAFKNADGKEMTVDSLYVTADYGTGALVDLGKTANNTFRLIPLRVDESPYTDLYFKTRIKGPQSKVRVSYTTKSAYVSPGCGIKKTYENVSSELLTPTPVTKLENGLNQIENENKTNLFLFF